MTRPAKVIIDLDALRHNLSRIRQFAPHSKIMAIVKADAYGHGIARIAAALTGVNGFGVACLEEARQLREAGIDKKILLLEGPYSVEEISAIQQLRLDVVIHHQFQFTLLNDAVITSPINAWLKLDSGMHRLGFAATEIAASWARLKQHEGVAGNIRLLSHLASANEPDSAMTKKQIELFSNVTKGFHAEKSLANSAGIIAWKECHLDWVRPGLMLYGVSPIDGNTADDFGLSPVMSLESELISIKNLKRGDPVGYGASWSCPEDMPIGIVAAGYGDGFPRHAGSGTTILVNGKSCSLVGRASMDMLTIDLRNYPGARIGDPVLLWGKELPVEVIARYADTVPYELLCGVHKRLEFIERGQPG